MRFLPKPRIPFPMAYVYIYIYFFFSPNEIRNENNEPNKKKHSGSRHFFGRRTGEEYGGKSLLKSKRVGLYRRERCFNELDTEFNAST